MQVLNGNETICSSGVKVIDCPDCVQHWTKQNLQYLKFLQDVDSRGMTLNSNGEEVEI